MGGLMANIRIIDLPTQTEVDESVYIPVESQNTGTRKYPIGEVLEDVNDAVDRVEAAIDAVDDISSQAIPLMSDDIRGGSKIDENGGLELVDEKLRIGSLVQDSNGYIRGGIAELTAKGHAEQFSTTGKNLAMPNYVGSKTLDGITWVFASNGQVTANGTSGSGTPPLYGLAFSLGTLEAGSYTATIWLISGSVSSSTADYGFRVRIGQNSNAQYFNSSISVLTGSSSVTFTADGTTQYYAAPQFTSPNGPITATNAVFVIQLEAGSTATEYEPYTGGAPSPSPDYPQEIQVVRGRNLLPLTLAGIKAANTSGTWNGNVYTIRNCTFSLITNSNGDITSIVANGTAGDVDSELNLVVNNTFFPSAGTYTLSGGATNAVRIFYYDGTTYYDSRPDPKTFSLTGSETVSRCVCIIAKGNTASNDVFYPQLELGSVAHDYVPYGDYVGMEVQGKNLLPNTFVQGGINGSTGKFNTSGSGNRICTNMFAVSPNTQYTLTFASSYRMELYEYDANETYLQKSVLWRTSGYIITTQSDTAFIAA
jgi:hypothetical protein